MKITFLGTGCFYGNPRYGGVWDKGVDSSNPKNTRLRYSILLEDKGNQLLIDCSPDFRQQSITHKIKDFNDVFYTHLHADHTFGTFELEKYAKFSDKHLNLWADIETLKALNHTFGYMFERGNRFTLNEIVAFRNYKIANMDITTLEFDHGSLKTYGIKYGNTVISADAGSIPSANNPYLENLDLWIMECGNIEKRPGNVHFYLEQALEVINKFKPKRAILTHFGCEWDYETMSKKMPRGVELAYDGMVINK